MRLMMAIDSALSQMFDWRGRASRSEFWWFFLFYLVCWVGSLVLSVAIRFPLALLVIVGLIAPMLGVVVRRLHDTGRSGAWYFLGFVPFGSIALVVFYCLSGDAGDNAYGPPPVALAGNSTVTRGMTKRQVTRLLGSPGDRVERTLAASNRGGRVVVAERLEVQREYWHYIGLPDGSRETMLTFERGRVVDITAV